MVPFVIILVLILFYVGMKSFRYGFGDFQLGKFLLEVSIWLVIAGGALLFITNGTLFSLISLGPGPSIIIDDSDNSDTANTDGDTTNDEDDLDCLAQGLVGGCIRKADVDKHLKTAHRHFNVIENMTVGKTEIVTLVITKKSDVPVESFEGTAGIVETAEINVSPRMRAQLSGPGFSFSPEEPIDEVEVTTRDKTTFSWAVTPKFAGPLRLRMRLWAIVTNTDGEVVYQSEKLSDDRTILVKVAEVEAVSFSEDPAGFWEKHIEPWWEIGATLLALSVGVLAFFGINQYSDFFKKKEKKDEGKSVDVNININGDSIQLSDPTQKVAEITEPPETEAPSKGEQKTTETTAS
jgi:hypothetical protein